MTDTLKIAILGAATLRGKELNEALAESSFTAADFSLMDDESQLGRLESVGDEMTFIQRIEPSSFAGKDFVFFTGSEALTRKHWHAAQQAGAGVVDLSYALERQPGVVVRAPWLEDLGRSVTLSTAAVVPAHPVAVALALIFHSLKDLGAVRSASATVLEPASEYGHEALDELHQQTVGLLNFQTLPKAVYDTQIAFNLAPALGAEAKADLKGSEARIRRHYALLAGPKLPGVSIQLLHAPVFHGHSISLAVEFVQPHALEHVEAALGGEHLDVILGDSDADVPNNLNAVGQGDVLLRVRTGNGSTEAVRRFWIWAALDNLRFGALNAIACAQEIEKLRPRGRVQ